MGSMKQEFSQLEQLLVQTANDATKCLKVLKRNLRKYDQRYVGRFHYRSTAKYFMKSDIHVAKDMISELRDVAKRISRSKEPTKSEVNAARSSMNGAADAINDLKQAGQVFDQNRSTRIPDDGGMEQQGKTIDEYSDDEILKDDTVEAVVISTLCSNFSGFSALDNHLSAMEKALLPW